MSFPVFVVPMPGWKDLHKVLSKLEVSSNTTFALWQNKLWYYLKFVNENTNFFETIL